MGLALMGVLGLASVASASTATIIQPASVITYNEEVVVNDTIRVDSAYIGKQGTGGVTFFNGTILNNTTDVDTGAEMPVTFGDNVRIDGEIYRTEKGGDNPIKISDHVIPTMTNINDFGSSTNRWKDAYFSGNINVGGTVDSVDVSTIPSTYLPLSGGSITGNLSVDGTTTLGSGSSTISGLLFGTCSIDPPNIVAADIGSVSCSASGVVPSDKVLVTRTGATANSATGRLLLVAAIPGTDSISISLRNEHTSDTNGGPETWTWLAIK